MHDPWLHYHGIYCKYAGAGTLGAVGVQYRVILFFVLVPPGLGFGLHLPHRGPREAV